MTALDKVIRRRYGVPGGGNFPYLVDTAMNKYIVYAASFTQALALYKRNKSHDPHSITLMSDNE